MAKKVNKTENKKLTDTRVCLNCKKPITDDKKYICEDCRNDILKKLQDKDFLNSHKDGEWVWMMIVLLIWTWGKNE